MAANSAQGGVARIAIKAMGLFGGVQVLGILCSVVRTKLVALWLGEAGIGLFGILNNALEMLNTGTNLGVRQSSVRDIAQSVADGDSRQAGVTSAVIRRWSVWLGVGGALLTIALSPLLSRLSFKTTSNAWMFVALAVAVLLMALTNGRQAVLQGTRQLKRLARVGVVGSIAGLVVSIPMFYYWRMTSVVPSIVAYAVAMAVVSWLWRDRTLPAVSVAAREVVRRGRSFIALGAYMTVGTFSTILAGYLITALLSQMAGLEEVGIYQSGYTLVNKYTGIVLTALGMEFYPRLAARAGSGLHVRVQVSQQLNVAVTVMVPIVMMLSVLRGVAIELLYSDAFVAAGEFVLWSGVGLVARAVSWCIAFVMLARGDGKVYMFTELSSAVLSVVLAIGGYRVGGIAGMGVAYTVWYLSYALIVWLVYAVRYRLRLSRMAALTAVVGMALPAVPAVAPQWMAWTVTAVVAVVALLRLRRLWGNVGNS